MFLVETDSYILHYRPITNKLLEPIIQQVRTVRDLPVRQFLVDVCCFGDRSEIMREGTENIGENDHLFVLSTSSLKSKTTTTCS